MGQDKPEPAREQNRDDKQQRRLSEERDAARIPPAGPHARPDLTNPQATPGAGTLPPDQADGEESDPGAG